MNALLQLLALYASILLVNSGLAVALWLKNRTELYKALMLFWGSYTVALVVQGAAASNDLTMTLGFAVCFLSTLSLGRLFAEALDVRFPGWTYTKLQLLGVVLSVVAYLAGLPFVVMALPVCIGICGPLIHILVVYRRQWNTLTLAGRGLLLSCIIYSAHTIDFAFLRKVEWFAPIGFTIAVGIVFAQAVLAFAVVHEVSEARARAALAATADELMRANQSLRDRHEALEAALHSNVELAREAKAAAEQAEAASRAKSSFLANMSHELRTPLNAVIGYAELLEEEELIDPDGLDDLRRIRVSAGSLLHLVDETLDLARVESGRVELVFEEVDVADLVSEVIDIVRPAAANRNNVLEMFVDDDLQILLDRGRVRQVLLNLVGNAVKFTDEGSVVVEARHCDGLLRFIVRDTGMGIPADQVPHLFQPFTQATKEIAFTHGGTGLGLALSDRFVRLMAGHIQVETRLGHGSTFTVVLPVRRAPVQALHLVHG